MKDKYVCCKMYVIVIKRYVLSVVCGRRLCDLRDKNNIPVEGDWDSLIVDFILALGRFYWAQW